jgi:hypothetical protein
VRARHPYFGDDPTPRFGDDPTKNHSGQLNRREQIQLQEDKMEEVKTYKQFTKAQKNILQKEGDNPYEPRWLFQRDGDIYYQKWNNKKPLKVTKWRTCIRDNETGIESIMSLDDFFHKRLTAISIESGGIVRPIGY